MIILAHAVAILGFESIVALPGHLLAGSTDDIG
jgi:hypothetical protein